MRELLAAAFVFTFVIASDVGLNLPCNREMDGLLAADPDGNPSAFLSCQSNGAGSTGYWERRVCPDEMVFDFINQRCQQRKHRKQPMLNIAILNNSCAHGETCIGGTVCDLERLRCLCPYGTVPQLETLSCIKPHSSYGGFGNFEKSPSTPAGFLPNPSQTNPPPFTFNFNPLFGKETYPNYGNQNSNNKYGNANGASGNEFSSLPSGNNKYGANGQWNGAASGSGNNAGGYNGVNSFSELLPKPGVESQPFVFKPNFFASTSAPVPTKKVPTLARPGQSCRDNEMCIGGSLCTLPIALCLCPGELEEKDGECVLPASATIQIEKVGIGALCSDLAECDHGSTCVMGRCACVAPLIQHEGRCVLRQERKEVGPGELCDNGEVCVRGSVCDTVIPVCVCPPNTDLSNGDCVHISSIRPAIAAPAPTYTPPTAPAPQLPQLPATQLPPQPQPVFLPSTTPAPVFVPSTTQLPQQPMQPSPFGGHYGQSQNVYQEKPVTAPIYPAQPSHVTYSNYQSTMPPPTVRPTSKPNLMKISLGGSKQSGVGVPCSLNTDCMIGAYCNGNTNPPSCQCLSTHVNIEGRCERVVYPGQVGCRSDLQCSAAYTGTKCVDRICVCPEGYKEVDQTCVPEQANPNERCGYVHGHPECSKGFSCINQICVCPTTHTITNGFCSSNTTDHPLTQCDEACEPPRKCLNNRCVCPDGVSCASAEVSRRRRRGVVEQSMVCWPGASQCSAGNGVCIDNVCHCTHGFVEVNGVCAPEIVRIGENCDPNGISPRCPENAVCKDGICQCATPGGCDRDTFMAGSRLMDGRCTMDRECPDGQCVAGRCQCNDGFALQNGACTSITGAFKNINGQCTADDRCSGGSTCRGNVCQCVDGSSELHGRCRQSPGGRCSYGQTCDGGSSCEFGLCRCPDGHIIDAGKCVMGKAEPGKSCQHGQKCVHGSVCRFGMCMCIAKYMASKGRCVRRENVLVPTSPAPSSTTSSATTSVRVGAVKGPGFECHEKDLCSGGSRCRDGFCVCNEFEVIINEQCVGSHEQANEIIDKLLVSAPGQPCDARTNCTGGSICINRTCTCEQGNIDNSGTCTEAKKEYGTNAAPPKKSPDQFQPGFTCTLTIECPYRTECLRGVCRCKKGETIVDNTCRKAIHQVLPGGKCDPRKGYDCVGEAHCFYGVCTCTRHLVNNGKECATIEEVEMVTPGKRCGLGQTCSGGARCLDGFCRCPEDEVPDVNKKCVKKSQVYPVFNKYPTTSEATSIYYPNPVTATLPSASANSALTLDKAKELEAFEALLKANPSFSEIDAKIAQTIYGHICRSKDECPANSFCFQQLCRCMLGYRATGGYCEPITDGCAISNNPGKPCGTIAHPGEDCTRNQVCSYNSYCGLFSGVCECPSGMATMNGRCERTTVAPGLGCVTSKNCHSSSYCDNGLCLCKTGYQLINNFCVLPESAGGAAAGAALKQSNPNSQEGSILPRTIHSYPSGMIPLDFTKPPFNFASKPEIKTVYANVNSQQATSSSYTPSQVPRFQSFPVPFAKGASTKPGDVESERTKSTSRLRIAMPGDYCGDDSICIGNSLCQKQFCRCPPNTFAENGICSIRRRLSPGPKHSNDHEEFVDLNSQEDSAESRQFAAPLENCQNFEFCTGGSECLSIQGMGLVCQCPTNTIFLEDECVDAPRNAELAGIGESCQDGEICLGGSRCIQNICMCDDDKHDILGICVTTARPGDDCSDGQICVDGAVCAASVKTCVCPPGRMSKMGRCVENGQPQDSTSRMAIPGEPCGSQSSCADNSFCSGERICVCMPRFANLNGRCVPSNMVRSPGEECHLDNMCTGGSTCSGGACTCPLGQLLMDARCVHVSDEIRRRPSQNECEVDGDCAEHYQCVNRMCVCHGDFSRCLRMVLLRAEQSCREDAHCPEYATCNENLCVCNDGYKMIQGKCIQRNLLKQKVTMKGTKTVKDIAMKITKPSGPGAICGESHHCAMGSVCFHGYCVCGLESVPRNGSCVSRSGNIGFGEKCSEHYKCRDGLSCVQDRCACLPDNLSCNESEPVTSPPGGACTDSRICVGGSVCREGWCICPDPTMIVQRGICIQPGPRPTLPPSTASINSQVHQPYLPRTAYQNVPGAGMAAVNQYNIQQGRKIPPGASCGPLDTCVGGAMCVDGMCVCPSGMQASAQGRCEKASTPATSTAMILNPGSVHATEFTYQHTHHLQSRPRPSPTSSSSSSSYAAAAAATQHVTHAPTPTLTNANTASEADECAAIGLYCRGNTVCRNLSCQCPDDYVLHHDGCVPPDEVGRRKVLGKARHQGTPTYARPGQRCANGETCVGGSVCNEMMMCACPPEKPILQGDACVAQQYRKIATPGESCDENTECTKESSCHGGQCRCQYGYIAVSGQCVALPMPTTPAMKNVVLARPLDSCDNGEQCEGGSSCDQETGVCMCPPGYIVYGVQCQPPPQSTAMQPAATPIPQAAPTFAVSMNTECADDTNCGANKVCVVGRCKCRPGFVDHDGVCEPLESVTLRKLKYGQTCNPAMDTCIQGSSCIDQVCKCGPGFALSPNGWCERFDFNMEGRTSPSYSSFQENYYTTTTQQSIVIHTVPDEHPLFETTASQSSSRSSSTGPKVIRHRFLGTKCRDNDVCINGGECREGVCRCPERLYERDGRCLRADQLPRAAPSESCAKGEMCTGGSICDNDSKTCICAADHLIVDGICRSKDATPFAAPGQSCSRGEDCSGGSYCADGICQCDSNHFAEDGYCRHIASRSSEIKYVAGNGLRFSSKAFAPRIPSTPCNETTCRLPDCFCSLTGRKPPGGLAPNTIPQFVVLTFDDAVNGRTLPDYRELFETVKYRNPNGCPVKATFFISHEWTNYDAVQWLFQQGMELASNSISHVSLEGTNANRWLNEMDGQRRIIAKFANANEEEIVGMRAPQLALGGDEQFEMMARAGFLYDNSMSANPGVNGDPFWPQTLDHSVPWDCYDANCPKSSFPGIWTVPLNQFYGTYLPQIDSFRRSSMVRAAVDLNTTVDQLTNMLFSNFDRSYTASRAPYVLALNADLLQLNGRNTGMQALQRFLEEVLYRKDVYVVTLKQLIQWMKNPVPLSQITQSEAVKCSQGPLSQYPAISQRSCSKPNKCMYRTPGLGSQEHQFLTCSPCPDQYPWLDNPIGNMTP
ncbi:hypothetical protein Y032_0122g1086 [Ancylostoma ceylanicum]|nr:hypothetical protein Y032_0122g1086 [Ancylostoma ceylanicum]